MDTPPVIDKQAPPLSLFEDVFEPLISQSRNIVIQYQLQFECSHDVCINNMMKCSVNGCCSPDDFFKKLSEMVDSSVRAMFEALKCSHFSYWQSYIAYVQNKLQDLTSIVVDESVIHHDINGNFNHIHSFKSFLKCHLKGEQQDYSLICGQWIRLNFENFANVWLQIIDDTIKRFDLIHDQLKQSLQTEPALINYISGQKWKFSFTVSELGCFFFVLKESGTLLIPNGLFSDFIRWSAVNFQSLNRSDIQPGSLRNKVIVPDLKAVDSLVFKLKEMLSILYEYQERMTK